jgi:hypothetical protein
MISRRALVLVLLPAALAITNLSAAEPTAREFVEAIYANYKGKDAKGVSLDRTADLRRYFVPALVTLIEKDAAAAKKRGEVPTLDGDPFVNAQEWEIENSDIAVREIGRNKAAATVSFMNFGKPKSAALDLVKLKVGWRIADIAYENKDTLRGLFKPKKAR